MRKITMTDTHRLTVNLVDEFRNCISVPKQTKKEKKISEVENALDGVKKIEWSTNHPNLLKVTPNPKNPYEATVEMAGGIDRGDIVVSYDGLTLTAATVDVIPSVANRFRTCNIEQDIGPAQCFSWSKKKRKK